MDVDHELAEGLTWALDIELAVVSEIDEPIAFHVAGISLPRRLSEEQQLVTLEGRCLAEVHILHLLDEQGRHLGDAGLGEGVAVHPGLSPLEL